MKHGFDIFVSYASADRDRVAPIAQALADYGWSVWWDRQIQPGKTFDDVIEAALDEAKAVVCVWTEAGIVSRWVRTEAAEGAARSILVPVLLDDVRIPLAFRRIQAADLTDWEPGRDHAGFAELITALRELVDTTPAGGETQPLELEGPVEQDPSVAIAQTRAAEKDWEGVIAALDPLESGVPGLSSRHPEAVELLALARRKRDAAHLYEETEVLHAQGRWRDVVARFDRILELDPDFEYGTDLRERASRHMEQEREQRLTNEYDRATEALKAREWDVAVAWFEQLLAEAPDYRDASDQLARARAGSISENRYRGLQEMLETGQWDEVVAGVKELAQTAPDLGDPGDLLAKAAARIAEAKGQAAQASQPTQSTAAQPAASMAQTRNVASTGDIAAVRGEVTGHAGQGQGSDASSSRTPRKVRRVGSFIGLFMLMVVLSSIFGGIARETWYSVSVHEEASSVARVGLFPGALYGLAYGLVLDRVRRSRRPNPSGKRKVLVVAGATLAGLIAGFTVFGVSELIADRDLEGPVSFLAMTLGIVSIGALAIASRRRRRDSSR